MKLHLLLGIISLILMLALPLGSNAQVKLASWNFNCTYTTATSNDTTIYTPTKTALVADPNVTTSNS